MCDALFDIFLEHVSGIGMGAAVDFFIDLMQAELVAQTTWRCQEKTEMVGSWKAKIYDMHNVQVGVSYL
jgi:hypothetical protein